MPDAYICYCSITSEPHVIEDGKGCGRCTDADHARALTPVHVNAAFKFFRDKDVEDGDDEDEAEIELTDEVEGEAEKAD